MLLRTGEGPEWFLEAVIVTTNLHFNCQYEYYAELLKHSKLDKNAPTCFGLHRNHLQGAKVSAWLKIARLVNSICVKDVQGVVSAMAAYCDL